MEKYSILYVDDEESNLRIFRDTFRRKFNVFTAISAKEGIKLLETEKIDLILSDQRMPEMSGIEFLKYTFEKYPETNRILVTGYSDINAVENAINQARVFQYVQKPWEEKSLLSTIEDALRIYHLEKENVRQKEELMVAKRKAEESDLQKTEFLNNLSHEIRTPLNGIYGFSGLLSSENITNEVRNEYIRIIHDCTEQLVNTVDHILAYTKLVTKQVSPQYKKISLNLLLSEIYAVFNLEAEKKEGINFLLKKGLADDESMVFTGRVQLYSILSNILDNAFKFTESGTVELGYVLDNNNVVIHISDTGVGIHPENQKEIFERFSREEKSYTSPQRGLGLGLSIAQENAALINANIWLESQKGKGTTFYVSMPYTLSRTRISKAPETVSSHPAKDNNAPFNILVAEDDYINYMYIEALLFEIMGEDTVVYHARNGKEAVEICQENTNIELVLMDINMPILNGYAATSQIKKFKPEIPVVAQTAYSTDDDQKKAKNAGCDGFIPKPINPVELELELKKYLV
jgi:signal transduction histidine kinase